MLLTPAGAGNLGWAWQKNFFEVNITGTYKIGSVTAEIEPSRHKWVSSILFSLSLVFEVHKYKFIASYYTQPWNISKTFCERRNLAKILPQKWHDFLHSRCGKLPIFCHFWLCLNNRIHELYKYWHCNFRQWKNLDCTSHIVENLDCTFHIVENLYCTFLTVKMFTKILYD